MSSCELGGFQPKSGEGRGLKSRCKREKKSDQASADFAYT